MGEKRNTILYDRIEQVAEYYGKSMRQLSMILDLTSPQTFYDIKSGKIQNLSSKILEKAKKNLPEINPTWLITGDGEMLLANEKKKIPLYNDVSTIGGYNETVANVDDANTPSAWVDAGDWFPGATAAIHHYGDSMVEYPSGCILVLKRVNDPRLLINGENYVIETDEFRITKQILDDGDEFITAYSTNRETHPDGKLIHAPIRIPKESIRHLDLVVGCVIQKFGNLASIR